ncbi:MAG: polysaccharide biosynthesis/export family protein [Cyanobacteriota bacterium]|nr:polysaccharide biosynthesis/export family protein [Cyanobacteriota bacterium]
MKQKSREQLLQLPQGYGEKIRNQKQRRYLGKTAYLFSFFLCWGGWMLLSAAAKAQEPSPQPGTLPRFLEERPLLEPTPPLPPPAVPEVPTPLPVPMPESPIPEAGEYMLGPGDRVQIDIFNVPEYSGENGQHQIQIDGTLNLPLIGNVSVRNMTVEQAKAAIEEKYGKYLQIPLVTLNVMAARPLQIALAGEVQHPGSYTMSPNAGGSGEGRQGSQLPTITQALKLAGGITGSADIRQVKVRRPQPQMPEQIININLWELIQNGDLRQNIALRDGDTIFVPSITTPDPAESTQLAAANFSDNKTQPINIAVVGEVARPGPYVLMPENASATNEGEETAGGALAALHTVTKGIKVAGGITPTADIRELEVRRLTRTGTEQVIKVNLWKLLQNGDLTQDLILQPGDTIFVPTAAEIDLDELAEVTASSFSPGALNINVVGEVVKPGSFPLPPKSSLNQALLAAGGFDRSRAQTKEVELIRLNPNGTVSQRIIEVDFSAEVNEETNPNLLDNDVVIVGRSRRAAFSDNVGTVLSPLSPLLGIFRFFNIFD